MKASLQNPLAADLDAILEQASDSLRQLKGARLFITGGTGFVGCWLLESIAWANARLTLDLKAAILSRDPARFKSKAQHLADQKHFAFLKGDVRDFAFPEGDFDFVINGATESSVTLNQNDPHLMFDTIVRGTERTIQFALKKNCSGYLLTSSGAVYGTQPSTMTHTPEEFSGGPDQLKVTSAYAEGKRAAEFLGAAAHQQSALNVKIARMFAFVGPYLPIDIHFAIGNFISDGLKGKPIEIKGDGTAHRSYLYASDMAVWLWTILLKAPANRAYNVGSQESHSILEIAEAVRDQFSPAPDIKVAQKPDPEVPIARYVPSTKRAETELGLRQQVLLPTAIAKTIEWNRAKLR